MDNFVVVDNPLLDPQGQISFFLWFRTDPLTGDFISKGGNSGYRFRVRGTDTGVLSFFDRGGVNGVGTTYGVSTTTIVWHSAAGVGSSAGLRIYLDGVLAGSGSVPYGAPDLSDAYAAGSAPFDGLMDEVKIFSRALSVAEVLALHNMNK